MRRRKQAKTPVNTGDRHKRRAIRWEQKTLEDQLSMFPPKIVEDFAMCRSFQHKPVISPMFLYGIVGSGKTLFATKVIYELRKRNFIENTPQKILFITPLDLFDEIRQCYTDKTDESVVVNKYKHADWLVIDDIGVEKLTEWKFEILYSIINYRYNHKKDTIITSNLSLKELTDHWQDERITRRIASMCKKHYKLV